MGWSRCISLLPRTTLHSDSEQMGTWYLTFYIIICLEGLLLPWNNFSVLVDIFRNIFGINQRCSYAPKINVYKFKKNSEPMFERLLATIGKFVRSCLPTDWEICQRYRKLLQITNISQRIANTGTLWTCVRGYWITCKAVFRGYRINHRENYKRIQRV